MRRRQNKAPDVTAPTPNWLVKGVEVVHVRFGTGTIAHIGDYKGTSALWIDFDTGTRRTLETQFALPYLRPRRPQDATTAAEPEEQCDYCGGRPVVVTVTGPDKVLRRCNTHHADLAKDLRQ